MSQPPNSGPARICTAARAGRWRSGPTRRRAGFTLIELMIVVALIGILSAVAQSTYQMAVARSRRSEAFLALSGIYSAQVSYHATQGLYADTFDQLGFQLLGAQRIDERTFRAQHYTYTMTALVQNGVLGFNFQAVATGDIDPSDAMLDILIIENDLTIVE